MGKVESFRRVPHRSGTGNGGATVEVDASALRSLDVSDDAAAGSADGDELLALLAAGDPPAFATDSRDRIVFWNRGMADLLGRMSHSTLGHRCYETLAGRDVFGNRFCYANCPVIATLRAGDPVRGFELKVATSGPDRRAVGVTILKIPGARADLFTVVHIVQPVPREGRLAQLLAGLPADVVDAGCLPESTAMPARPVSVAPPVVTKREAEVLQHLAAGLQNKEVAQKLGLSVATIRNHVHNILDKLGVHSKLEAVCLSFRNGWVVPGDASARASAPPAFFTGKS